MRILVTSLLGVLLVVGAFLVSSKISKKKKAAHVEVKREIVGVFTEVVNNEVKPIIITANGTLVAKNKIEIFSEVQGVFERSGHDFKPGTYYKKGEVLLKINSEEHRANLQVQKSNLYQKLISVLPDLKLDYPEQFEKWNTYITDYDVTKFVNPLPSFETTQEKLFISGKGIQSAYFLVKNQQERLGKYTIHAPFSGILTKANVTKGTLIRGGQQIGSFINPNVYELEVAVNNTHSDFLKVGRVVKLNALDGDKNWSGKVIRINSLVDQQTQSVTVFIQVSGKELREGMYLQAEIAAEEGSPVFEINRSLLGEGNSVFVVVKDSILQSVAVEPIHFSEKTVLIKGLVDGTRFVNRSIPGAFDGKIVKILD